MLSSSDQHDAVRKASSVPVPTVSVTSGGFNPKWIGTIAAPILSLIPRL
jgi:hypothetical protein